MHATRLPVALRFVALAQLLSTSSAQQQKPWLEAFPIVYVLYGPKGPIARAIVDATDACPELVHAGDTLPVKTRGVGENVMPSAFPVRVCDGPLPRVSSGATFGGKPLPATTDNPERFLLMGDTGLRIKPKNNGDCASAYTGDKLYGVHTVCSDPIDYDVEKVDGHFQGVDEPMEVAWPLKEGVRDATDDLDRRYPAWTARVPPGMRARPRQPDSTGALRVVPRSMPQRMQA